MVDLLFQVGYVLYLQVPVWLTVLVVMLLLR
jgi:hypothetical protein